MTVQNIINEVNSIQTKKEAIKEAITAKGVTSEGKLSKFADEIKQISTGEPDWYMINRIRHDNGNEGIYVRTNVSEMNQITATQLIKIGNTFKESNDVLTINAIGDFYIVNGSYFPKKESICRVPQMTSQDTALNLDGNKDNFKFTYKFDVREKAVSFYDIKNYNYLKQFRNNRLVDFNALYIKSDAVNVDTPNSTVTLTNAKDIINPTANIVNFTASINGGGIPMQAIMIDSTTFIKATKNKPIEVAGFIRFNNDSQTINRISLVPVDGAFHNVLFSANAIGTGIYTITEWYKSMPMGNYVYVLAIGAYTYVVFVGINYVVNADGLKEKNIEVYPYHVTNAGNQNEIPFNSYTNGKAAELYIHFTVRQEIDGKTMAAFRNAILTANGTPDPKPMYLNGLDMLGRFTGLRGKFLDDFDYVNNLFSRENCGDYAEHQSVPYGSSPFRSMIMPPDLAKAIKAKTPIKAFIRLNDNTNNMTFVEFEEIPNDGKFTFSVGYGQYGLTVFQKGINNDNRVIIVFFDNLKESNCKIYRLKKAGTNQYITNDLFDTTQKDNQLFITANKETIDHINKTPLATVWTEIQNTLAHKEDYEAYSISNLTYEQ